MSEMDEITQHAARFGAQLTQALGQLSQAASWLERRTLRKNIRKMVTDEQKQRERMRQAELASMNRALETYRLHSISTTSRATDPAVAPQQRERDRAAMVRHYNDLEDRILRSSALTTVEQGIALDGMAAATTFPEYRLGNVFGRAHRVKGVEALRYRAQVARAQAAAGIERRPAYVRPPAPPQQARSVGYSTEQVDAIQAIRRSQATDHWGPRPENRDAERQHAAQWAAEAGLSPDEITREFNHAAINSQVSVQVNGRALNGSSAAYIGLHPNEQQAAAWARENFGDYVQDMRESIGEPHQVGVTATDRASGNPLFYSQGPLGLVADGVDQWRAGIARPVTEQTAPFQSAGAPLRQETARTSNPGVAPSGADLPRREFAEQPPLTDAARERGTAPAAAVDRDEPGEYIVRVEVGDASEPENPLVGWRNPAVSEQDAAEWAHFRVETLGPEESGHVQVEVDRDAGEGRLESVFASHGPRRVVEAEVADWHQRTVDRVQRDTAGRASEPASDVRERAQTDQERLTQLEQQVRELKGIAAERDDLAQRVVMLGRGIDAVTADRDEHKRQAEAAAAEVETLKNVTTRQQAELKDLRAQSLRLVEVTAERDRLKSERDEAVRKIAHATPEQERYGSEQRRNHDNGRKSASRRAGLNGEGRERNGVSEHGFTREQAADMINGLRRAEEANRLAREQQRDQHATGGETQASPRETISAPAESNGNGHQKPGRDPIERSR